MKINSNTILIILTACIVAGFAYWYFFVDAGNQPALTTNAVENPSQAQFQMLVTQLPTSFDTAIFLDKRFQALHDLTTPITAEPVGRLDPFAPVAGVSAQQ